MDHIDKKSRQGQSTIHNAITTIEQGIVRDLAFVAEQEGVSTAENVNYAIGKLNEAAAALRLEI